jgi:gluconokinase
MGPSGSGKSAVGAAIAATLGIPFVDGDDLHSAANVEKMLAGSPLDDEDRMPWLDAVGRVLRAAPDIVVACSALARRYRERILQTATDAVFVELAVGTDELRRRMQRRDHFMPPALLDSQLAAWERLAPDEPGFSLHNDATVQEVAARAAARLTDQFLR